MDASQEIDTSVQAPIIKRIKALQISYDLKSSDEKFADVVGMESVRGAFPLSQTYVKAEGKGNGWGKTTLKVRANMEDVAAFLWDFESRCHLATTGDIERRIEKKIGDWEMVVRRVQKIESKHGAKHHNRVYTNIMKLHKVDLNTVVISLKPKEKGHHRVLGTILGAASR